MDFATQFMQGFTEERKLKKSEEVRKTKAKALQDVLKSISTLMEPHEESSTSFPDIPAPSPGGMPPVTLGTPPGAPPSVGGAPGGGYGAPPAAAPAAGPPSFFAPPPAAPVTTTKTVAPDRQEILRGALKALGGAEYAPETAKDVHALMPDFFKPTQTKVVGGKLIDEDGKVIAEGHEKPSYGVSEAGWLTTVHPDGTVQEHVGTKPMQTSVAGINATSREKAAGIAAEAGKLRGDAANAARIAAAKIVAQGGIDRVAAAAKYAKDLTRYKLDRKDEQDPKTVAAYYVKLLQAYQADDADESDIQMMEYLRPIVEKQGLLGALLQGGGEMPAKAEAPWEGKGPKPPAPAAVEPEKGWYQKLFGGKPDANTAPVPEPIKKGAPALPAKKGAEAPKVSGGGGFTIGGQKVLAPEGHSDADIKMAMTSMQKRMKEGHSKEKLLGILKKQGWTVQ